MEVLAEFLGAGSRLRDGRDKEGAHAGIFPPVQSLIVIGEVAGDLCGHPLMAHGGSIRFQENMESIFSLWATLMLQDKVRIRTDGDRGCAVAGNGIPKRRTFIPVGKRDGTDPRKEQHTRMNVGDEKRVPDADLGELVMAESFFCEDLRRIAVLDQDRYSLGGDRINLFLHEARDAGQVPALLELVEPAPKRPNGAAGEHRKMIDRRDAQLMHEVQQFDVAVLKFKSIFRRHVSLVVSRMRVVLKNSNIERSG